MQSEPNESSPLLINSNIPGSIQEWDLDEENLTGEGNIQSFGLTNVQVGNSDPLISDEISSSRVVEIVLDDAYQPVATVTLGGNEPSISEHWFG